MIVLVLGGSGSGKSAFAEEIATSISNDLLYIATMQPFSEEALARIDRHVKMRKDKGFLSVDCYTDLDKMKCNHRYGAVLLECMSNLLANEMYKDKADFISLTPKILNSIDNIKSQSDNLIIVSNDIGCDINGYSDETLSYIKKLGEINQQIAKIADIVVEVVCSIPIYHKGSKVW